ncbi:unnamed protein product [Cuscuta epithymum]|uniref:Asn/Gln amidotransferase domain-containing protein n=1 Tax=Cuscuta epithymum TaxID=186058 RepID=A0AAV0F648_9ASTE|nr:unnamed protein product [Cuscuta epithymum]
MKSKGEKFVSRVRKCVFVGYVFGKKGWNVFDLETRELFVSRDVKFFEQIFPFASTSSFPNNTPNASLPAALPTYYDDHFFLDHLDESHVQTPSTQADSTTPPEGRGQSGDIFTGSGHSNSLEDVHGTSHEETEQALGRGQRTRIPSVRLKDFVTHTIIKNSPFPASSAPPSSSGQIVDPQEIEKMVDEVIADNPKQLEQYRGGKTKLQGHFAGQVMKESKGKANPNLLNKILLQKLNAKT